MSNIYLKIPIEKKQRTQNFASMIAATHADIIKFSNFLLQLKNQRCWSEEVFGFSIIPILKGNMTF